MRPVENELNIPGSASEQASAEAKPKAAVGRMARLFKEYAPAVRAFLLRRLGSVEEAREATQEVFLKLWRQEQKGLLRGEAAAYLFATADNWAKDCRRKAVSHVLDQHESLEGHELPAKQPNEEDAVHWRQGLELVVASIKELPAETQRIFYLYHGTRMSYTDIAKELGITPRTVERHMSHAIAHCQPRLKAYLEK